MPNLIEFSNDVNDTERKIAHIVLLFAKKYNLSKIKIRVNLQDLREYSPQFSKELYEGLVFESTQGITIGVSVKVIADFVPMCVSYYYRYYWQAWLGYWWFKWKKTNPTKPKSFYSYLLETNAWEIEVLK